MKHLKIYGLILSAGFSGRMQKFKPLLDYKGKFFIQNIMLQLSAVCHKIIIVSGYKANEIKENISQLKYKIQYELVFNPDYESGMFTSLQAGIRKAQDADWILYHFVDQPGLPDNFYIEFVKQIDSEYNWIQPSYKKRHGHPILLGKDLFELIVNPSVESNLREISKYPIVKKKYWGSGYNEIFQDIDTEEDYNNLK